MRRARHSVRSAAGVLFLAATVLIVFAAAAGAQSSWVIERFDVDLRVAEDGVLSVTEEIGVDFGGLQRHGIFRSIPVRYDYSDTHERVIDVSDISVTGSAGTPTEIDVTTEGAYRVIRIGDPDRTISGRHVYRISYEVRGALNSFDTHEELYWNATGDDWDAPIRSASVTLSGPPVTRVACFAGPEGSTGLCQEAEQTEQGAVFRTLDLPPSTGMTVVVGFVSGSVDVGEPILDEIWSFSRAFSVTPFTVGGAVLVLLLGVAGIVALAWREGRDRVLVGTAGMPGSKVSRPLGPDAVPVQFRPPDDLKPAQLGVLLDERVDNHDIAATIVDLAVRGHLTIEQRDTKKFLFFSQQDWVLTRHENEEDDRLQRYERRLMDGLFADGDEVNLSELSGSFHEDFETVQNLLYANAMSRKWFARRPDKVRDTFLALGIFGTLLAIGVVIAAAVFTHYALVAVPLVIVAMLLAILHRWMPRRTPKGSALLRETLGFREFIVTAEADRMDFAERENMFVKYLPYAVMFAAVDKWAQAFADLDQEALAANPYGHHRGPWFVGGRDFNVPTFSAALADFSARAGSSLSTRPASSGSSGFSSGGGFSGGGVGGGGGGSW